MCGIAGCFGVKDTTTIDRMLDALPHRGPDDRGLYVAGQAVLGHTRLSIVDVAKGHQPILAEGGRTGIICNGEIYNYQSIRERLRNKYDFTTHSDSEVVLHLYSELGPDCVRELDGMFAFAVFNGDDFMLARDPVGIKPLYYGYKRGHLYFSSELGAMSLAELGEVHEFPCGHYYTPADGFVPYYQVPRGDAPLLEEVDQACDRIRRELSKAVQKRLLSDVEIQVGSFLSGGLDSSLIAALAAKSIPNLHTFAVGMNTGGRDSDDLIAARRVAEHIGSDHHELVFSENDYYQALPRVIEKLETYDPSLVRCAVPCYFTCKLAAEYVTVVLTGEGADEVFAGYQYMKNLPPAEINPESRQLIQGVHNINLQRADRMGMLFSLEPRVPFFDVAIIDLGMSLAPDLKIREQDGARIEKWVLRKAFEGSGLIPDEILWRCKVQYTQGAGCEDLGERLAQSEMADAEYEQIKTLNPGAVIDSKEAAYYFKIFRQYHPQDSMLKSIGIWPGFTFEEERAKVQGTI